MSSASSLVVERIVEGRQRRTDDVDRIDQRRYDRSSRAGAVIERLNLTIAPGTFLGVSGPTGAGKTRLSPTS
jgi:ABC-type multidrug transport system fused ATPase/permease subunit